MCPMEEIRVLEKLRSDMSSMLVNQQCVLNRCLHIEEVHVKQGYMLIGCQKCYSQRLGVVTLQSYSKYQESTVWNVE